MMQRQREEPNTQERQTRKQQEQQRQQQPSQPSSQQQKQHRPVESNEVNEGASPSAGIVENPFTEVVKQEIRAEQRQQQQQQQQLQTTSIAGGRLSVDDHQPLQQKNLQEQRREQLNKEQHRPARKQPDKSSFVSSAAGVTYFTLYQKVRLNPNPVEENNQIRRGNHSTRDHLRLLLKQGADAGAILGKIQEEVGESGTALVVADMGEVIIPNIDILATEADIRKALQIALEKEAMLASINVWEQRDGSLPARYVKHRSHLPSRVDIFDALNVAIWSENVRGRTDLVCVFAAVQPITRR
uniref:Uncharacterized protein n=1 Tax=Anopheles quadriannulatus TaxID=34691 RepID=A0A182XPS0_ANOQN